MNQSHSTLQKVAKVAGVSVATASYVLNDSPRISAATKARVRAVMERIGYRPNPRVASLMAHISRGRTVREGERLALIWVDEDPGQRYNRVHAGVQERVDVLGYRLEEFWLREPRITPTRLQQVLRARGINGIVFGPLYNRTTTFSLDWDWSQFSPAIIGQAETFPPLHHAAHHHHAAMRAVMIRLGNEGNRRIGAIFDAATDDRGRRGWSSAFLAFHPLPASARRLLCRSSDQATTEPLKHFVTAKVDALIVTAAWYDRLTSAWPRRRPWPRLILLERQPWQNEVSGIDQMDELIGANAVDLVVGQLHRNERGAPEFPKSLLSPGRWMDAAPARRETGARHQTSVRSL